MPLRKASGNMYPWVTHTHSHLGGECPHQCTYCYVNHPRWGRPAKYTGPLRLNEEELEVRYGEGKTIFVENCGDLFAVGVVWIDRILRHCRRWPHNVYVFQTKNPWGLRLWLAEFPTTALLGVTIETNRDIRLVSQAPTPIERHRQLLSINRLDLGNRLFVSVEPVMDFDPGILAEWIGEIAPLFVSIGADSKGHGLPEPDGRKITQLVEWLAGDGMDVRLKSNLQRLVGAEEMARLRGLTAFAKQEEATLERT